MDAGDTAEAPRGRLPYAGRLAGLQDLASGGLAVWVWLSPAGWRHELVGYAVLFMLVEFVLIHASGMFGAALEPGRAHTLSTRMAVGMLVFYLVLVAGFAAGFDDLWILAGAAWLLTAKAWPVIRSGSDGAARGYAQRWLWGASTVYYLLAVGATTVLPVPELGIVGSAKAYGIPGDGGLWVSEPQTAVAALAVYFLLLGVTRLVGWDVRAAARHARTTNV